MAVSTESLPPIHEVSPILMKLAGFGGLPILRLLAEKESKNISLPRRNGSYMNSGQTGKKQGKKMFDEMTLAVSFVKTRSDIEQRYSFDSS